jgi:RNA polymerase sigma-70 factor (ECF subfamily)
MDKNEAFQKIYREYYKSMFDYARKRTNEADAKDVVHNVFLKLFENFDWLADIISVSDKPEKVRYALFVRVRNECNDFYRHSKITKRIFTDMPDFESEIFAYLEQEYQNTDMYALLMIYINKLSELNRNIFNKFYIEGYSTQKIAEELGLTVRAVESRIYRILNFCKKKMSKEK